ncbi:AraC family transcriptional regulator [Streptomyces sp. ISL-86]|uniref:helix-turn-helix transcriptional regulator n=1 Tax=Streptomyces sp. ISL-86 TaxID=2819187 RepID=UPI001BE65005|nr:AraC family transcriptional regulator [Streptomyces sp. ISL-86]MBT2457355.1 helix-turn-helix transcriptional regulator [Streptomyces sp. ISL-86]
MYERQRRAYPGGAGAWRVEVEAAPCRLVIAGMIGAAREHAHAAVQVLVCGSGRVLLGDGRTELPVQAAVVPAGHAHRVRPAPGPPPTGVMVYLDADTPAGRALHATAARGGVACWAAAASVFAWAGSPPGAVSAAGVLRALDRFGAAAPGEDRHPALAAALAVLPGAVADGPVRVGDVAARAGVSASRLGHLFAEQLGWSFPAAVRWARLHAAIAAAGGGANATEAAHAAGFADSAHLTRVFKAMFGITPSQGLAAAQWTPTAGPDR